jgi:hypothetical protein
MYEKKSTESGVFFPLPVLPEDGEFEHLGPSDLAKKDKTPAVEGEKAKTDLQVTSKTAKVEKNTHAGKVTVYRKWRATQEPRGNESEEDINTLDSILSCVDDDSTYNRIIPGAESDSPRNPMDIQTHVATVTATAVDETKEEMIRRRLHILEEELRMRTAQQPPLVFATKAEPRFGKLDSCAKAIKSRLNSSAECLTSRVQKCNKKVLFWMCIALVLASVISFSVHFAGKQNSPTLPPAPFPTNMPTAHYTSAPTKPPATENTDTPTNKEVPGNHIPLAEATIVGIVFAGVASLFAVALYLFYSGHCPCWIRLLCGAEAERL